MLTGTSVVDLPSTTFCSAYFGLGSSLAQVPSWMCAGCDTPFGAPLMLSSTLVLSPAGVSLAVPLPLDLFCCESLTLTDLGPSDFFLGALSLSCANASPPMA